MIQIINDKKLFLWSKVVQITVIYGNMSSYVLVQTSVYKSNDFSNSSTFGSKIME